MKERNEFRERVKNAQKAKFWIPKEEGDFITGEVKGFRTITSRFGDGEVMEIIDDETKELIAIFLSSVIQRARETQNIKIGERIGIKYLGEVSGEHTDYKDYIVLVDRPEKE